jgi:hypothetical protein
MIAVIKKKQVPLGQVVITPPAEALLQEAGKTLKEFRDRHATGDWGEIEDEDWDGNEEAFATGGRLMSVYKVNSATTIWTCPAVAMGRRGRRRIITESDRSATTILLPDDY